MTLIEQIATDLGITGPSGGSWIQAIALHEGATGPVNGSWIMGWASGLGLTGPVGGSWDQAIALHYGATGPINGSWLAATSNAIQNGGGGGGIDPDAQAFLTAAAITDATITTAIDTLVKDLKTYSLWTKIKALYPYVGGTATTHKYNLKDPVDTNGAFRQQFVGGWIHSTTGIRGNGMNAYANSFLNPSVNLTQHNNHIGYYGRTNYIGGGFQTDIGCNTNGFFGEWYDLTDTGAPSQRFRTGLNDVISPGEGRGFIIGSITANNSRSIYKNGTLQGNNSMTITQPMPNADLYIGAINYAPLIYFSYREYALVTIGDGLNATEVANYNTAVQTFQTTLSRQV